MGTEWTQGHAATFKVFVTRHPNAPLELARSVIPFVSYRLYGQWPRAKGGLLFLHRTGVERE